jgi:hypothetical protein
VTIKEVATALKKYLPPVFDPRLGLLWWHRRWRRRRVRRAERERSKAFPKVRERRSEYYYEILAIAYHVLTKALPRTMTI